MALHMTSEIADQFDRRVQDIRTNHGDQVQLDDVADIVAALMATMEGDLTVRDIAIHREIRELSSFITKARDEIAALQPKRIREKDIPGATDELDAVVEATEEATNSFLDCAEMLGELSAELSSEQQNRVTEITFKMFEASNFQDITGQRISKVVTTLRKIDTKVTALAHALGEELPANYEPEPEEKTGDAALLNGPAEVGTGNSQDDIDALLASFD